jgi:AhpD family alkylhydroperoxidase
MLTPADRELVGIGASIGAGCHSCLEYHLDAGSRAGLGEADLLKAIEDAECVRRSASGQLSALGRRRLGQAAELPADCCDTSDRAKELAAVGAAVAANSQANLEKHLAAAQIVGLSARELDEAVRLARAVQRRSAEILAEEVARLLARPEPAVVETVAATAGCGPDCGCGDATAVGVLPMVAAVPVTAACGPDCGCASEPSESIPAPQVIAAAAAAPASAACGCGCS